jgi:hypothetical protein
MISAEVPVKVTPRIVGAQPSSFRSLLKSVPSPKRRGKSRLVSLYYSGPAARTLSAPRLLPKSGSSMFLSGSSSRGGIMARGGSRSRGGYTSRGGTHYRTIGRVANGSTMNGTNPILDLYQRPPGWNIKDFDVLFNNGSHIYGYTPTMHAQILQDVDDSLIRLKSMVRNSNSFYMRKLVEYAYGTMLADHFLWKNVPHSSNSWQPILEKDWQILFERFKQMNPSMSTGGPPGTAYTIKSLTRSAIFHIRRNIKLTGLVPFQGKTVKKSYRKFIRSQ